MKKFIIIGIILAFANISNANIFADPVPDYLTSGSFSLDSTSLYFTDYTKYSSGKGGSGGVLIKWVEEDEESSSQKEQRCVFTIKNDVFVQISFTGSIKEYLFMDKAEFIVDFLGNLILINPNLRTVIKKDK